MGAWDKTLTRKDHFVHAIETQLRGHLGEFVAHLAEKEKQLLAESAHQGRLIGPREFEAKFGGRYPMPKFSYGYREEVSLLVAVIEFPRYANEGDPELVAELIEPLRRMLPRPAAPPPRTLPALPRFWPSERRLEGGEKPRPVQVHEGERVAPAELSRVLRLIQGGKLAVANSSRRPTDDGRGARGAGLCAGAAEGGD
jgi:hypothetical protein